MSTESQSLNVPHVHVFENGIIATVEPGRFNSSTLILSGPWYKYLVYGLIFNDGVWVHGWKGPDAFQRPAFLDQVNKRLTCIYDHGEIEQDLKRLATLRMIKPDFE